MQPVINQSRYLLLDRQEVLARMKEKSTILIVDDSELNRTVLADILGDEYNFIEAENGARAIELLRTHTDIDLILLDMVMPEMNGFDVLTAMNNNRQIEDIPVVMISAENGIEHIERAYDLGVTDYISRRSTAWSCAAAWSTR